MHLVISQLHFSKDVSFKFRNITGAKLWGMTRREILDLFQVTTLQAKKLIRSMQENMHPGSITFDQSYAKGLRASGTKMKRATDMTVDEVQVGAREQSDVRIHGEVLDWHLWRVRIVCFCRNLCELFESTLSSRLLLSDSEAFCFLVQVPRRSSNQGCCFDLGSFAA